MLEVLDPAQNHAFVDHYLNLQFDLSSTLFICTANNLFDIPAPLRDRMEVIRIAGYTVEEKVEIAWRYLIPRLLEEHGITDKDMQFTDEVLGYVSSRYSREAGLRNFERNLAAIMRKRARKKADGVEGAWIVDNALVEEHLGVPRYAMEEAEKEPEVGAVTGLAWTSLGGDIMTIEALRMPGTGRSGTGQLGDDVSHGRALLRALTQSGARRERCRVQGNGPAHSLSRRRRAQGRSERGDGRDPGHCIGAEPAPDPPRRGDDRRGDAPRQDPRDRRGQGENARRLSRRPAGSDPACREPEGPARGA
jgi:hypothetical protein